MTDYLTDLRGALTSGIARRRARRRRAAAATVTAVAVLAVTAVVARPGAETPALAIERTGEWIELRIADATADPEAMTGELRDAGIDAAAVSMPVDDRHVGRWLAAAESPEKACARPEYLDRGPLDPDTGAPVPPPAAPQAAVRLNELVIDDGVIRIRRDFAERPHQGRFVFLAGRAPKEGEQPLGTEPPALGAAIDRALGCPRPTAP